MPLGRLWAGQAWGTHLGKIFATVDETGGKFTGTLKFNESGIGITTFALRGEFDGEKITFTGAIPSDLTSPTTGQLRASAILRSNGSFHGQWETDTGAEGTFVLHPHSGIEVDDGSTNPPQLLTDRHTFKSIAIDKDGILRLAASIGKEFKKSSPIISIVTRRERSLFVKDFEILSFSEGERASIVRIYAQEPEEKGLNKTVSIEFGPNFNSAMVQGGNESWVLGTLEKIKRDAGEFESLYATNFKKFGIGINQVIFFSAIVFLPSLKNFAHRAILMLGILLIIAAINWAHNKYIPLAIIYVGKQKPGLFASIAPSVKSWIIAATAGVAATLLATHLEQIIPIIVEKVSLLP